MYGGNKDDEHMDRNLSFQTQASAIFARMGFAMFTGYLVCTSSFALGAENSEDFRDFLKQIHSASEDRGFSFTGKYTVEGWGNLSGGVQTGAAYDGLLKLTQGLDLKKIIGWGGASIFTSWLYPHGKGLSDKYTGELNLLSNIEAYNSFRLFELWFQQKFFGDAASIRIGQMSADLEFYQSENSNVFINSCFGTFPTISFGTSLPIYPVGGLGVRVDFHPSSTTFARAAVFDSNPGQQNTNDKHGTLFHLNPSSGVIVIAEAGYQVMPSADNKGKDEAYTIGAYYDSRTFTGNFIQPTHSSNCGFYAIADRRLYRSTPYINEQSSNAGLGAFVSCSVAPPDRNEVSFYMDGGINYTGLFSGRDKDLLGFAVSYTKISNDYVVDNIPVHSGHETVLEATYRFCVKDSLYLQPDFQYIFDPGAFRHLPNAVVVGMRFDLTF
jgi:porin